MTKATHMSSQEEAAQFGFASPTRQRVALADLIFAKGDRHLTVEELHEEAVTAGVPVSLATVYNTLHQFTEAGMIRVLAVESARTYFDTECLGSPPFLHRGRKRSSRHSGEQYSDRQSPRTAGRHGNLPCRRGNPAAPQDRALSVRRLISRVTQSRHITSSGSRPGPALPVGSEPYRSAPPRTAKAVMTPSADVASKRQIRAEAGQDEGAGADEGGADVDLGPQEDGGLAGQKIAQTRPPKVAVSAP